MNEAWFFIDCLGWCSVYLVKKSFSRSEEVDSELKCDLVICAKTAETISASFNFGAVNRFI